MQVLENYPLKKYNTFGIDAFARYFTEFRSVNHLREALETTSALQLPTLILGGGSNILLTKNFEGIVLKNDIPGIKIVDEDEEHIYVRVGAGISWNSFVMYCVDRNLAGIENLSLIPGNVGASPMQNIGAYGVEIKDVFHELEAFHLKEKSVQKFSLKDCRFGYRDSVFKNKYKNQFVILNVTYRLKKEPVFNISYGALREELDKMKVEDLSLKVVSDAVVRIRTSKLPDPAILGNAGSFFKNPLIQKEKALELQNTFAGIPLFEADEKHCKIPAGWLIEQSGWKGYRKKDAGCYEKQALVLVNYGSASGKEIHLLGKKIQSSVKEKFGIRLESEVNII